jgi:hypothetical protein
MSQEPNRVTPQADEAWKDQIANERAAAESPPSRAASAAADIDPSQLPPASMTTLVTMLSTQAMVSLGLFPEPGADEPRQRLPLARHFIDLLGVIESKTRGNLSAEESQLLDGTLHELRMAFVHMSAKPGVQS